MRHTRHPWDHWFSRKKIRLKRGKDFDCQPYLMAQQIRNEASRREIAVTVSVLEDYVTAERIS